VAPACRIRIEKAPAQAELKLPMSTQAEDIHQCLLDEPQLCVGQNA
jgi:hypothetical protein